MDTLTMQDTLNRGARSTLVDYSAQIRAEITVEVERLKKEVEGKGCGKDYGPTTPIRADVVILGSIINTHHGRDLFLRGDFLCGLPVQIDSSCPRTITVRANNVEFVEEGVDYRDEDGEVTRTKERFWTEDVCASVTW